MSLLFVAGRKFIKRSEPISILYHVTPTANYFAPFSTWQPAKLRETHSARASLLLIAS